MCGDTESNERSSGWCRRSWGNILKSLLYRTGQSSWWVPTVMSRGDQSIRSCWALATTSPAKRNSRVMCECACGLGVVFTSVCVCVYLHGLTPEWACRSYRHPIKSVSSVFRSCVGAAVSCTQTASSVLIYCVHWRLRLSRFHPMSDRLIDDLMNSLLRSPINTQDTCWPNTHRQVCACINRIERKIHSSWVRQKLIVEQLMYRQRPSVAKLKPALIQHKANGNFWISESTQINIRRTIWCSQDGRSSVCGIISLQLWFARASLKTCLVDELRDTAQALWPCSK